MRPKYVSLIVVFALLASGCLALPAFAERGQADGGREFLRHGDVIDIGPVLRAKKLPIVGTPDLSKVRLSGGPGLAGEQAYSVGDTLVWLALDDYRGRYFFTTYTVITISQHAEVWVQDDLNYYDLDGNLNLIHPSAKDPLSVTEQRMNYLAGAFDQIIHPTNVGFFGPSDSLDGTGGYEEYLEIPELDADDGSRVIILVSNVRDTNYYFPVTSGSYIAGFYSPTFEFYSGRNMITIDSKQWDQRLGGGGERPYLYDSILAHEYQHLIHDDVSPHEESWVNEGMSGFAEFLNGYYLTDELGDRTQWQEWPENSLVLWGDQDQDAPTGQILADYQIVNAFALYTTGRIGGVYTDTAKLTRQPQDGIEGFNAWLQEIAATNAAAVGLSFAEIFGDFRRAMLHGGDTDDAQPRADWNADYIGSYKSPLQTFGGGPAASSAKLGRLRENLDSQGYSTPGVPPFGTDFIELGWSTALQSGSSVITFDGDETPMSTFWSVVSAAQIYTPTGAVSDDVLYSGHHDLEDNFMVFGPVAVAADDLLSFDSFFNIEEAWDYGFVQATTDLMGMSGWASLGLPDTMSDTEANAHPIIVDNVPGFSGLAEGWSHRTFDLGSAYAGQSILLAFRYSTDWASGGNDETSPPGWAIDNVAVGSTLLSDGSVMGRSIQAVRGAVSRFAVEFLTWSDGMGIDVAKVRRMPLDAEMRGSLDLEALRDRGFDEPGERGVLMVSLMMDSFSDLVGGGMLASYADYSLRGLPPSIYTSDVTALGETHRGDERVYAGEPFRAAVHADNLGSSPNLSTRRSAMMYIGMEIPSGTVYQDDSATAGAKYTNNLHTVAESFPSRPGVYWIGSVRDVQDIEASFVVDADLPAEHEIDVPVHFASGSGAEPDQYFADTDTIKVTSPIELSGLLAVEDPVFIGMEAQFTAKILNLAKIDREVTLVADVPDGATYAGVIGATEVSVGPKEVTVKRVVPPYATDGITEITFRWDITCCYCPGLKITSEVMLKDSATGDSYPLSASANILYGVRLPLLVHNWVVE